MRNQQLLYATLAVMNFLLIGSQALLAQDTAGIGVALSNDDDHVVIGQLLDDGSAAKSGKLEVGDWIIAVSDESTPFTDVASSSIKAVVALVRGKTGTTVHLTVVSKGETQENAFTVPLTRGSIPILEKWGDGKLISAGKKFPKFEMTILDGSGETLKSTEFRGRITVFEIWSTWCGPCLKLMADHQQLAAQHALLSKEIVFVAASIDDKADVALKLLTSRNWNATTNVWLDDIAIKALHIRSIPIMYVVGADGTVLANSDEEGFRETLDTILENLRTK